LRIAITQVFAKNRGLGQTSRMEDLIASLKAGTHLDDAQIAEAAAQLVDAAVTAADKAHFLRALAHKGETPAEIAMFVKEFLKLAVDPGLDRAKLPGPMLDVVGTGGDQLHLFNVSSTAMFILAAGGVCVTKHGNRGITSKAGGADVLEALGIKIDLPKEKVVAGIESIGLGFFFAPLYHPTFKAVAEARKMLAAEGQRSIFNILGPLLNPGRPDYQLIGVFDPQLTRAFGEILVQLGRKGAWVVHGSAGAGQGMDELSTLGVNEVYKLKDGNLKHERIDPQSLPKASADELKAFEALRNLRNRIVHFGGQKEQAIHEQDFELAAQFRDEEKRMQKYYSIAKAALRDLVGGDAQENAVILEGILSGAIKGAKRDIAVLNAAAGFVITGLAPDLPEGRERAEELLDRGAAHAKLRAMQDLI
jgi:anthranilate phosphoribosyltransferase